MPYAASHIDEMPNWPGRMGARIAARYLGVGLTKFRLDVRSGRLPAPVREGNRVFWAKRQLDDFVQAEFGLSEKAQKNPWDSA